MTRTIEPGQDKMFEDAAEKSGDVITYERGNDGQWIEKIVNLSQQLTASDRRCKELESELRIERERNAIASAELSKYEAAEREFCIEGDYTGDNLPLLLRLESMNSVLTSCTKTINEQMLRISTLEQANNQLRKQGGTPAKTSYRALYDRLLSIIKDEMADQGKPNVDQRDLAYAITLRLIDERL